VGGDKVKIRGFNNQVRLFVVGAVFCLWIPIIFQSDKKLPPTKLPMDLVTRTGANLSLKIDAFGDFYIDNGRVFGETDSIKFSLRLTTKASSTFIKKLNVGIGKRLSNGKWDMVNRQVSFDINQTVTKSKSFKMRNVDFVLEIGELKNPKDYWIIFETEQETIKGRLGRTYAHSKDFSLILD